jgi:hypothetical protein
MMPSSFRLFAALLLLGANAPVRAWGTQGHMASGAIAYDILIKQDSAAIDAVAALMARHPDRARNDSKLGDLTGADRMRRLFEVAARWPDDIRATGWNHTHWHHQLRVVSGWTWVTLRVGEADGAFAHNLRIVRDAKADPGKRAIALCWVIHIAADMHQPLHAGHRMDARFPITDKAGTIGWVRRADGAAPETFHHFWDTAADRAASEADGADAIARAAEASLSLDAPLSRDTDFERQYRLWVRESERIAADVAYRGSGLEEARHRADAPVLAPDYAATAKTVSEQRLGQAGARIAAILAAIFPAN